jgi:hypothetical protein
MLNPSPLLSRTRVAILLASALALAPVLLLALPSGSPSAGALPAQRFTTRSSRPSPSSSVPTTEDPGPPSTRSTRPRPTQSTSPPVTRSPSTAAPRSTTRRSSAAAPSTVARATTVPTVPPSTAVPELLTAGPNNTSTGGQEETKGDGVSTTSALKWVIIGLVIVGLAIAALTVAYWRHTRPRADGSWDEGDRNGDGPSGPASGTAAPRFTPLASGGAEPYRPPGTGSWSSSSDRHHSWDPAPTVTAGERVDPPWGAR